MQRKIFVVTAAYGYEHIQAAGGQKALLPVIAKSGADGVEIRRELFTSTDLLALAELGLAIEHAGLQACYSAPEPLFIENGDLNPQLPQLLQEAKDLKSLWLKVSLGHFGRPDQLNTLRDWLASSDMALVVENDQTPCGRLQPMLRFKEICQQFELPVKLTFDMGNWLWVGNSPEEAAYQLANSVDYIHVKAALPHKESFRAVPPDNADSRWLKLLAMLPADVPRGIEFPLEGADLAAVTRRYVDLLRKE
ncbi:TPA: sugar phosphate isomerase/epimerase [Escherichia fergusonii]|uniref:sugar phosphate isomerase/epimerase family protein n=1 Tax=Escherichia fergusonii TaxID=564 RepID=UPI0015E9AAAE|nr:sugar phosphate isomerase/epimerase [Escherichia fergusonii]EHJ4100416.1 sugar phosphate isomerase/epimerase [Escherichia fergusonii]MEB8050783.1 sugar phosphate isomerase/epimerase [Escherichia fergusonii]MEB8055063.1 sugar phosphate isomerase/epimerase [Escherichia fergusonii]QMF18259.1 sugar phosphate isomerase/epimerase [Escherichia fergusonii]QMH60716.1 sugar phosphate isomerase/epimerase [Escherichia fergusonii]